MSLANNDFNWRLVAAADIAENSLVTIDAAGKAALANGSNAVGFVPQAIKSGERCPVIRGGTISGLTGFVAGARIRGAVSGGMGTTGTNPVVAVVKSEDASEAVITAYNFDQNL